MYLYIYIYTTIFCCSFILRLDSMQHQRTSSRRAAQSFFFSIYNTNTYIFIYIYVIYLSIYIIDDVDGSEYMYIFIIYLELSFLSRFRDLLRHKHIEAGCLQGTNDYQHLHDRRRENFHRHHDHHRLCHAFQLLCCVIDSLLLYIYIIYI